ncbi:hypothetical protein BJ508DRAFT_144556 [Ascobolus immersus RN42]|uniref:Uncharacterized protein n=1 Tax=Ascobolus immersus RN42 TaxID=1160509 RepID=A0A3N4I510_ASCIM|nr:hypothetical protein BJ508DRAFT_144556 [Ascobolus immersus RN42]
MPAGGGNGPEVERFFLLFFLVSFVILFLCSYGVFCFSASIGMIRFFLSSFHHFFVCLSAYSQASLWDFLCFQRSLE